MGRLLAAAITLLTLATVAAFATGRWWFPLTAAAHGGAIDRQFKLTLWIVTIAFVAAQLALAAAIWRFRSSAGRRASHFIGSSRIELICFAITATVFIVLAAMGQQVWAGLRMSEPQPGALEVEITAQQFVWNFRYAGKDGRFGATNPALYNDENNSPTARPGPLGIDPSDSRGTDDLVSVGVVVLPLGKPVRLIIRSKDVTHSFFVPELRIKQDAVPGLSIGVNFTPTREGRFEIACAELCGLSHHKMRGFLEIRKPEDFESWLEQKSKE